MIDDCAHFGVSVTRLNEYYSILLLDGSYEATKRMGFSVHSSASDNYKVNQAAFEREFSGAILDIFDRYAPLSSILDGQGFRPDKEINWFVDGIQWAPYKTRGYAFIGEIGDATVLLSVGPKKIVFDGAQGAFGTDYTLKIGALCESENVEMILERIKETVFPVIEKYRLQRIQQTASEAT